jgi:hypothetical protein
MDNPETQETLGRRHRKKTNKPETNTTLKTIKINMEEFPVNEDNINDDPYTIYQLKIK